MATADGVNKIAKSRKTIIELLSNRGYDVSNYEGFSMNEIHVMTQNNQLDMLIESQEGRKVYIKYHLSKTLRPQNITDAVEDLFEIEQVLTKSDDLIIIAHDNANESLLNDLKLKWDNDGYFITIFSISNLQYNMMENILVPPHIVLAEDQKNEVKKEFNIIDDMQFPEISRFDPAAKCVGLRPGELCKIIRSSKTAITAPFYRICI